MEREIVNPWEWQDQFGFVQANKVSGAQRTLFCAGQGSIDAEGQVLHAGDMGAQTAQALDNLTTVLEQAGFQLADVVRLNYYVTDREAFFTQGAGVVAERLQAAGCRPASTLVPVPALALDGMQVELEATAVQ